MLNLDPAKLLVIGLIALVVLGPERLPRVARQLGGAWRELTKLREQVTDEVKNAFPVDELPKIPRIPNVASSISSAVSSFSRPIASAVSASVSGTGVVTPDEGASVGDPQSDSRAQGVETPRRNTAATRRAPDVVVHGSLGEFAFLPDDPDMN